MGLLLMFRFDVKTITFWFYNNLFMPKTFREIYILIKVRMKTKKLY